MPDDRWMEKARRLVREYKDGSSTAMTKAIAAALEEAATTERQAGRHEGLEEAAISVGDQAECHEDATILPRIIRSLKTPQAAGDEKK